MIGKGNRATFFQRFFTSQAIFTVTPSDLQRHLACHGQPPVLCRELETAVYCLKIAFSINLQVTVTNDPVPVCRPEHTELINYVFLIQKCKFCPPWLHLPLMNGLISFQFCPQCYVQNEPTCWFRPLLAAIRNTLPCQESAMYSHSPLTVRDVGRTRPNETVMVDINFVLRCIEWRVELKGERRTT